MRTRSLMMAAPVLATIAIFSGSARAQDEATPAATPAPRVVVVQTPNGPTSFQLAEPKKYKRVWYGWQTLTLDGVAIASGAILAKGGFDGAGWVWIGTYAFGPPVVHALHGRIGIAFADLGIRVGAPVVTTLIGGAIGCSGGSSNNGDDIGDAAACATGLVLGFLVGYAGAIAVDAAVLAREKVEIDPQSDEAKEMERERRKRASTFSIVPDMGLGQNRATFGLQGQF
jgi:hypothetical protein